MTGIDECGKLWQMDFERFSQRTVKCIDKELKRLLKGWRSEVGKIDKSLLPVVDKFIKANEGGKRIRGILVVLGYEIVREKGKGKREKLKEKEIIKVAAAYEIFHTAILAHDDIIDQSLTRRDQPSLYQALGGGHKGISLAISLADAGFFLAIRAISESQHLGGVKALSWFSQTMLETSMGQILELEKGENLTVARYKSAKYSVSGPLVLGAILGGVSTTPGVCEATSKLTPGVNVTALAKFGENLGIAFQIQDDILDSEVDWIGGSDSAKKAAEKYKNQALKVLSDISKDQKMSKILQQLAEYLVRRTK